MVIWTLRRLFVIPPGVGPARPEAVIRHGRHPPRRAGFDQDGFVLWRIRYQDFTEDNGANEVLEARKRKFLVTLVSFR